MDEPDRDSNGITRLTPRRRTATPASDADLIAQQASIRRSALIGGWVWPIFTLLDVYMCLVLYPSAPLALLVAYRVGLEAVIIWVYRQASRPGMSVAWLVNVQSILFVLAAFCIALMSIHFDGIRSMYIHGISLVCLVRAALVADSWRQSWPTYLLIALAFPIVMGIVALLSPLRRADWLTWPSLAIFLANYVFVVASAIVGAASGQAMWAARQQVYRARRLGRYRLQAPLGKGGMGEVWLAWDASLRRNVALKILRTDGPPDPGAVRRFEREAQSASRLRVPHSIQVYDFGASDDGIYYIAMEYLPGFDLGRLVAMYGPQPPARCIHFVQQACLSLEEAHAAGIIHRDIKPQNLFVTRVGDDQDFVKLLDFGIARLNAREETVELTQTGLVRGTPLFLAPEVWRGGHADERTDLYALGGTLYFLLTGFAPFDAPITSGLVRAHLDEIPKPPSARSFHAVPPELDAVVLQCLDKRPEHRFPSARALYDALAAVSCTRPWGPAEAKEFWTHADATLADAPVDAVKLRPSFGAPPSV